MVYMFYFIIPVTRTAYTKELAGLNTTSTTMQQILPITNMWWVIFPMLIAFVGAYTIYLYMTKQQGFDYDG